MERIPTTMGNEFSNALKPDIGSFELYQIENVSISEKGGLSVGTD